MAEITEDMVERAAEYLADRVYLDGANDSEHIWEKCDQDEKVPMDGFCPRHTRCRSQGRC